MTSLKRVRLFAALYVLISVLFMQLAVAGHACVAPQGSGAPGAVAGSACHMPDQEQDQLCKSHCERSAQSVDSGTQASLQAPELPLLAVVSLPDLHDAVTWQARDAFSISVPEPPSALRFCVLRI